MPPNPPRSNSSPSRGRGAPETAGALRVGRASPAESEALRGTLTVICGCMFSGKTTELLRRLEGFPRGAAVAFKHVIDTRYSASAIVSHGGKALPAIVVASASAIERHITDDTEMVAVDEAHFFDEGLAAMVSRLAERGIEVVLTSLQPDSWGRPFPLAERLLAVADEPIVTTATCARCGRIADRTQRLTPIIDGQMVVEPDHYEPRCRNCWRPPPEPPS